MLNRSRNLCLKDTFYERHTLAFQYHFSSQRVFNGSLNYCIGKFQLTVCGEFQFNDFFLMPLNRQADGTVSIFYSPQSVF